MGKGAGYRYAKSKARAFTEPFVAFSRTLIKSPAWRSLNGNSVKVAVEMRNRYTGSNNGQIILSYEVVCQELMIGKATMSRAIAELVEHGIIKVTKRGHFYGRMASAYAFTDRVLNGSLPTNEWQRFVPKKSKRRSKPEHNSLVYGPIEDGISADGSV